MTRNNGDDEIATCDYKLCAIMRCVGVVYELCSLGVV